MATRAGKKTFVRIMVEEKELMNECFEVNDFEYYHLIEMETLLSFIESLPKEMYDQVKKMLSMIDFKNGNILHYLDHLAKGYAAQYEKNMGL
jgi:hypothetical protein